MKSTSGFQRAGAGDAKRPVMCGPPILSRNLVINPETGRLPGSNQAKWIGRKRQERERRQVNEQENVSGRRSNLAGRVRACKPTGLEAVLRQWGVQTPDFRDRAVPSDVA